MLFFIYLIEKQYNYMLLGHYAQQFPTCPKAGETCPLNPYPPSVFQNSLLVVSW